MTQYYPNSTGYVMHAYRKDTLKMEAGRLVEFS